MNANAVVLVVSLLFLVFFIWYLAAHEDKVRRTVALAVIGSMLAICGLSLFRHHNGHWTLNIKPGLDLKGGTQFTLQLAGEPSSSALDQAVEVIRKRIDKDGVSEPVIQPAGSNRILVQIPGINEDDKQKYRQQLQQVARLEFKMVHPDSDNLLADIKAGKATLPFDYEILPYVQRDAKNQKTRQEMVVRKRAGLTGRYVKNAWASADQLNRPTVIVDFDSEGREMFSRLTGENIGHAMAIVLDGEIYSAPVIRTMISGSCEISGGSMSRAEAIQLASVLENPLETPVTVVDERGVDPTLGKASIVSGFNSAVIGLLAVAVFTLVYYRLAGVIAVAALFLNLFILLGLLAQFGFTLTMPGVAGIILTIGIGVDANVLIFERIREELDQKKPLRSAVAAGFNKAFSSILDANVTSLIASVLLYWQGSGAIQGFAVVLSLGILSSLFAALIVSHAAFEWLLEYVKLESLSMARVFSNPDFDFMKYKWPAIAGSLLLVLASVTGYLHQGDKAYGVDFVGGDLLTLSFEQKIPDDQIREAVAGTNAVPQYQRATTGSAEVLSLRSPFGQGEKVESLLKQKFPQASFSRLQLDKVAAVIGNEFKQRAAMALLLGVIGIFIYVMWRFESSYALGAIVALIHDVIITLGLFVLMGRELSLITVGAVLTIAGYSINDTIIVFDRIREGLKHDSRTPLATVMNLCINATLSRTLLTSGLTLIAVLALYLFGGLVIHDFALMLLLGIVVGTYSSIFIASPVVLLFGGHKRNVETA